MTITEDASGIDLDAIDLSVEALCRVPRSLALRHDVLAIAVDPGRITVVVPEPADATTIERVRDATGLEVAPILAPRERIRAKLSRVYPGGSSPARVDEAPAIRALDEIHLSAQRSGASDVHIEPLENGGRVRERVDGVLRESRALTSEILPAIISRVKLLAGMDIADRRQPQDGSYPVNTPAGNADVRASSIPTTYGEKIVLRFALHRSKIPALDHLGMPAAIAPAFRAAVESPSGLIVVCGPTGSGKTTTLYSALLHRSAISTNICTVEDPVEIRLPGISQVQLNARAGVTFSSALRAFLRQDPDAIMVGELRDAETAAGLAYAALTGQLVMTSVHANDAVSAITRLIDLGIPATTLAATLSAIVAQRLVRRATGGGRWPLFEALFPNEDLCDLIAARADVISLRRHAAASGYANIVEHGMSRLVAGETTATELRRVLPSRFAS